MPVTTGSTLPAPDPNGPNSPHGPNRPDDANRPDGTEGPDAAGARSGPRSGASTRTRSRSRTRSRGRSAGDRAFAPPRLEERARALAARPEDWLHRVRLSPDGRWYERLHQDADHEVWVISWLPGQSTGFHDHGGSSGAFAVALGALEEHRVHAGRGLGAGQSRSFGPDYVHDVRNTSAAPAVSVHVYAPPLSSMRRYDVDAQGELVELAAESTDDW
ncbi:MULTISPECIES: cysteine dioxygenase [Actinomadura]|uniref:Cysteine dioxygenase n=1 Tax=Actinomadura yumaensis TaxID=111807 RepID=A0ABW2CMV7_9ACTN|nr:cysteine dioxygenase family protein [Actinomadura sp. J1-007]MWK39015.1 cysteine dioxygenase [Actinomadura sp. J1-007]